MATNLRQSLYNKGREETVSKSFKGKEASGKYYESFFLYQHESVHKSEDSQDSRRRTIISCSTRQLLEIPVSCCLLTEIAASPVSALLFIKKEIRFNHCGEDTSVMPTAAADERKRF